MNMKRYKLTALDYLVDFVERYYYIFLLMILFVTLFNLFYALKSTPIDSWDEARHGVSAYEMLKKSEFVVNTYAYQNDYWNLKPPLSFWAIMLGYKLVGFNPLGLRLFSAIAALLTVITVALFVKYKYGRLASLISALVLTTTPQYILYHSARTGDADALFVLFFTVSIVALALCEHNIKWLYLSGLGFSLAFLTKSWHAGNIAIIIGIYLLLTKKIFKLKIQEWGIFFASSLLPILGWIILRFTKDGLNFFAMMIGYDLLARSSVSLEGHTGGYAYYLYLLDKHYFFWLQLFIIVFLTYLALYKKEIFKNLLEKSKRSYFLAILLWVLIPLLTFSKAQTKIGWYILPIYPALAVVIGILSGQLLTGKKRIAIAQLIVLIFLIQGIFIYEPFIKKRIVAINKQTSKVTIQNFEGFNDFRDSKAYIATGPKGKYWRQSDLLTAELYGDLRPVTGGLDAFLKDKSQKVILIAPKNAEYTEAIQEYNFKIVAESKSVFILRKQKTKY